jgi:hypothetical protein
MGKRFQAAHRLGPALKPMRARNHKLRIGQRAGPFSGRIARKLTPRKLSNSVNPARNSCRNLGLKRNARKPHQCFDPLFRLGKKRIVRARFGARLPRLLCKL